MKSIFKMSDDNNSVCYKNIYYINGDFLYLSTEKENIPYVNKWTNSCEWRPNIKIFNSENDIIDYINSFEEKEEIELSLLGDVLWQDNIAHTLYDGLYPSYLALIKFGYVHEAFTFITNKWPRYSRGDLLSLDAATTFLNGDKILEYSQFIENKIIHFKTLISGTGKTGNRVMNQKYTLYGTEYNGVQKFKERMLKSFNVYEQIVDKNNIKIAIINNKRYNNKEKEVLDNIIKYFNSLPNIDIKFIDWSTCENFKEQLELVKDFDIHISSPGTGMLYMPFLKKGSVNINLGYMEHTQTNDSRPNIKIENTNKTDFLLPGWMEQSVCAGANYISTLYYDRSSYNNIEYDELIRIINKAIYLIENDIIQDVNLNTDALVFVEYCKRVNNSQEVCDHLTNIAFFIELFVNEHPKAVPNNIVDIELLRKIKDEFKYNRQYEIKI